MPAKPQSQRTVAIPFPLKGRDDYWAYREQPLLTTPDALNTRTFDAAEGRARGGQRPGLREIFISEAAPTGSATPTPSPTPTGGGTGAPPTGSPPTGQGPTPTPTPVPPTPTPEPPTPPPPTPSPEPPQNTCNDCDPPIPDTLYVTFAGLGGDFAYWNKKTAMSWLSGCNWQYADANGGIGLSYTGGVWVLAVWGPSGTSSTCVKRWSNAGGECAPTEPYTELECVDTECADGDSCENSVGATAVVSLS